MKKRLIFSLIILALVMLSIEGAARIYEVYHPPLPADVRSRLRFQQLPREPLMEPELRGEPNRLVIHFPERGGQVFTKRKPPDEVRVVIIGGSAAAGLGVEDEACFHEIIERLLNQASPEKHFQVLNLGRVGLASAQVAYLLEKVAGAVQPDVIVAVMGNNEYLDVFSAFEHDQKVLRALPLSRALQRTSALARLLRPGLIVADSDESIPMEQKKVYLQHVQNYVTERLQRSLTKIGRVAQKQKASLLVCTMPANQKYLSLREWFFCGAEEQHEDFRKARWAMYVDLPGYAAYLMQKRIADDAQDISAHFVLALAHRQQGEAEGAKHHFSVVKKALQPERKYENQLAGRLMLATAVAEVDGNEAAMRLVSPWIEESKEYEKEESGPIAMFYLIAGDIEQARRLFANSLRYRYMVANEQINRTLTESTARIPSAHLVDLAAEISTRSPDGIPGFDSFLDYCHYNQRGHLVLAHVLARAIADSYDLPGSIPSPDEALNKRRMDYRLRWEQLPPFEQWEGPSPQWLRWTDELVAGSTK